MTQLRQKKLIKALDEAPEHVPLPTVEDTRFERFHSALEKIIEENLGFSAAKTLEYDAHEQTFFVTLKSTQAERGVHCPAGVGPLCFTVKRHVQIFPHQPIKPQIQRLLALKEEVTNRASNAAYRAEI